MSTLEEVKSMQEQGMQEDQIIQSLQTRGVSYRNISEALAQSKIKAAVENSASEPNTIPPQQPPIPISPIQQTADPSSSPEAIPGMQQSIMQTSPQSTTEPTQEYIPMPEGEFQYTDQYQYQPYEYAGGGISSDTITEISEQVVAERMMEIRKSLEKVTDFKTNIETKTEAIEERLRRLEEVINALQSSVLRKVGDYMTNVSDIKKELIETQKTFTKLVPELKKHKSHSTKSHSHKTRTHKRNSKKK
jgi:hypothetical protein